MKLVDVVDVFDYDIEVLIDSSKIKTPYIGTVGDIPEELWNMKVYRIYMSADGEGLNIDC